MIVSKKLRAVFHLTLLRRLVSYWEVATYGSFPVNFREEQRLDSMSKLSSYGPLFLRATSKSVKFQSNYGEELLFIP